jgi:hypothetical protein
MALPDVQHDENSEQSQKQSDAQCAYGIYRGIHFFLLLLPCQILCRGGDFCRLGQKQHGIPGYALAGIKGKSGICIEPGVLPKIR